ncbi:hypothetical protein [Bartonella sp. WD12.1]|uniref:hypothetical protein n=1 Tax=Bartonella sp. WD12.1 TaxID=1933903 RepID=UPI0013014D1F|nr:hypothetical protein [Bartonella sp. WD12.1]
MEEIGCIGIEECWGGCQGLLLEGMGLRGWFWRQSDVQVKGGVEKRGDWGLRL